MSEGSVLLPSVENELSAHQAPVSDENVSGMKAGLNPSHANLLSDIELALSLVKSLKEALAGAHPSIWAFVKGLF